MNEKVIQILKILGYVLLGSLIVVIIMAAFGKFNKCPANDCSKCPANDCSKCPPTNDCSKCPPTNDCSKCPTVNKINCDAACKKDSWLSNCCTTSNNPFDGIQNIIILEADNNDKKLSSSNQDLINTKFKEHGGWCFENEVQFYTKRTLFLLKPGTHNIILYVNYYMSFAGLGTTPNEVIVNQLIVHNSSGNDIYNNAGINICSNPDVSTYGIGHGSANPAATENFWRSVENLTVLGDSIWAVSQACPLRRVVFKSKLSLAEGAWASGGFSSDCIFNNVDPGGNQQWLYKNCNFNNTPSDCSWSTMYLNCSNSSTASNCTNTNQVIYTKDTDIKSRQKPSLIFDGTNYKVLVNNISTSYPSAGNDSYYSSSSKLINIDDFYITQSSDNSDTINSYIDKGKHIILSPGIYNLSDTIVVTKSDTIILGYGFVTLVAPSNGNPCILVNDDADNVTIASILFESKYTINTSTLLRWGGNKNIHTGYAHDIFTRVGGAVNGYTKCDSMVEINSNGIIGDNFWLWRADHGNPSGIGFDTNVSNNGLIVNGDNVVMCGLAVEHCQQDFVVWNGNNGKTLWFQSETPYDIRDNNIWTYSVYVVNGNNHVATCLGGYTFFNTSNITINCLFTDNSTSNSNSLTYLFNFFSNILGVKNTVKKIYNKQTGDSNITTLGITLLCNAQMPNNYNKKWYK